MKKKIVSVSELKAYIQIKKMGRQCFTILKRYFNLNLDFYYIYLSILTQAHKQGCWKILDLTHFPKFDQVSNNFMKDFLVKLRIVLHLLCVCVWVCITNSVNWWKNVTVYNQYICFTEDNWQGMWLSLLLYFFCEHIV